MVGTHFWLFLGRTRKWTLLFAAIFVIGSIILLLFFPAKAKTITQQWDNMQLWLGALTLFVACAVWLSEAQQEWKNNLPKRLSVDFKLVINNQENDKLDQDKRGRTIMRCKRAKLIGEGDIRALAQQIGRQMVNSYHICQNEENSTGKTGKHQDLDMIPMLDEVSDEIDHNRRERHYRVTVRLTSIPKCLSTIPENMILYWKDDFTILPQLKTCEDDNS